MSLAYKNAIEILANPERWEAYEGSSIVIVYLDRDGNFSVARISNVDPPYVEDTLDNSLWFRTLESAKRYAKKEMHVTSRFAKAKN